MVVEGEAPWNHSAWGEVKRCSFHWILYLRACSGVIHHPAFSSADGGLKRGGSDGRSSAKNPSQSNHMIPLDYREGITFVMANIPFTVGYFK